MYIIGGLVDHNQQKVYRGVPGGADVQGLTHRLAEERGISHARLPIGEVCEEQGVCVCVLETE